MEDLKKRYLTQKQVADILGVKVATLNYWRCIGKHDIPFAKIGRVILYPYTEFYAWLGGKCLNMKGDGYER